MAPSRQRPVLFGDVLALARLAWIRETARRLDTAGFPDYRRSDALAVRLLHRAPLSLGAFAAAMGASRQAARKVVDGLVARGFAAIDTDPDDRRRRHVRLTPEGDLYATSVIEVLTSLDREVRAHADPDQVHATVALLDAVARGGVLVP